MRSDPIFFNRRIKNKKNEGCNVVFVTQLPEDTEAEFAVNNNPFAQAPEILLLLPKGMDQLIFFLIKRKMCGSFRVQMQKSARLRKVPWRTKDRELGAKTKICSNAQGCLVRALRD